MNQFYQRKSGTPRWVVLLLIPLAFAMGYVVSDDARIEALNDLERITRQQEQLKRDVQALRELGQSIQRQCGATYARI